MNEYLENWKKASYNLGEHFRLKYFGKDAEFYWIGNEYGGVLNIGDYFFNMRDITDFVRYNYTRKLMFQYYDYALEYHSQSKHKKGDYLINIKNYKKILK